jgi:hypothetical protein
MTLAIEQCLSSNFHTSNIHLSSSMDGFHCCVVCFLGRYLSELLPPGRKQDAGKQNCATSERKKIESVNHASGLVCSLDTRERSLERPVAPFQVHHLTLQNHIPFQLHLALARTAHTFSMVGSHSLKFFSFLSSNILYISCTVV